MEKSGEKNLVLVGTRKASESPASARGEIVVYQPNETMRLDVRLDGETVWLTQS